MNITQQIRAIVANDQLNDLEKCEALRALIPPEVRHYPLAKLSSLPRHLVPAFEDAIKLAKASHRITKKAIADKIQEN